MRTVTGADLVALLANAGCESCDFSFGLAVGPGAPVKTLKEYAAWLKANPQKANFGSPAAGSLPHFFGEMLSREANADLVHVPLAGGAALLGALAFGEPVEVWVMAGGGLIILAISANTWAEARRDRVGVAVADDL